MKKISLISLLLLCSINIVACIQAHEAQATAALEPQTKSLGEVAEVKEEVKVEAEAGESLVYLSVEAVEVSSFDATPDWAPPPDSKAVIDGDLLTRWASEYADKQWLSLDFGKSKTLSKIVIFWEAAYSDVYDILISEDGETWQTILSLENQDGCIDELKFEPQKGRFVKIMANKRFNPDWGTSIWEIVCLGPVANNPDESLLSDVYPALAKQLLSQDQQQAELADELTPDLEEPVPSPGDVSVDEFQKGIVYTSWSCEELCSLVSDKTLEYLYNVGVRHLGIMVVWMQETIEETEIYRDEKDTPHDLALVHSINIAHSLGMKIMLKPHVDIETDQWRGDIIPSEDWFDAYEEFILHYANLAQQYNVEMLSVGTELGNTTLPNWHSRWEDIIEKIRKVYSGKLVYSANWDEYQTVGFWDKLDFVGIDAYFPITSEKDPTKEALIEGWKNNALEIDRWVKESGVDKPITFNELGYCSADGTNIQPWAVLSNATDGYVDQAEQADCLEAMLIACTEYSWFKGFYWWNCFPQERYSPLGYTFRGKKAEEVITEWFEKL